ncbi:hypothetical protein MB901379_01189 [Mycobacterium basiliense]|uniref:Uncharacterized protein n=1 Tax=Mycobacterium basiliense TaxID=2094119 RepID=A0A3S5CZL1_9MYCO|nr:hypothetical protein MB901379_01189 [Mycobacterium basiliense]
MSSNYELLSVPKLFRFTRGYVDSVAMLGVAVANSHDRKGKLQ